MDIVFTERLDFARDFGDDHMDALTRALADDKVRATTAEQRLVDGQQSLRQRKSVATTLTFTSSPDASAARRAPHAKTMPASR